MELISLQDREYLENKYHRTDEPFDAFRRMEYRYALTKDFEKAPKIAQCLKNLRDGAPQTTYDAMQMIYLYFILSESVDHYQVRSLGYGIDQTLYPFFYEDIVFG